MSKPLQIRSRFLFASISVIAGFILLCWTLTDGGRARRAAISWTTAEHPSQLDWPYERPTLQEQELLAPYAAEATRICGEGDAWIQAHRLLEAVVRLGHGKKRLPQLTTHNAAHAYEGLSQGAAGNCAHYAMAFHLLWRANGMQSRLVGLNGEQWLDGRGHAMVEIRLPEDGKWILLDPHNYVWFAIDGKPLSLFSLRAWFQQPENHELIVHQDGPPPSGYDKGKVIEYYRQRIERIEFDAATDNLARRLAVDSYPLGNLLQILPKNPRRLVETSLFGTDERVLYVDSPRLEPEAASWWSLRAGLAFLTVGLCAAGVNLALWRKQRRALRTGRSNEFACASYQARP